MFIPIEFQKSFQKTEQTALAITATYTDAPALLASRFGGEAYWPAGVDYPCDDDGKPLALLVQLNFADLPAHDELPASGLLQCFIPRNDDYYGANLDEVGGKSQLVTHFWPAPDAEQAVALESAADENDLIPVFGAHALTFAEKKDYAGMDTIECAESLDANSFEVLEDVALNEKEESQFFDAITDYVAAHGHKLLGYPSFINGDPRDNSDYRLLLQIDTDMDGDNDIMWGDDGVGQLFIRHDDLKAGRFDRLWLYWDC